MADAPTILIADRNSHIRMFLMREMMSYGYRVKLAGTSESVLKIAAAPDNIDLLIIDPDLPGLDAGAFLATMREKHPALPIVLHTHRHKDDACILGGDEELTVVEKSGDSAERLQEAVVRLLQQSPSSNAKPSGLILHEKETV